MRWLGALRGRREPLLGEFVCLNQGEQEGRERSCCERGRARASGAEHCHCDAVLVMGTAQRGHPFLRKQAHAYLP